MYPEGKGPTLVLTCDHTFHCRHVLAVFHYETISRNACGLFSPLRHSCTSLSQVLGCKTGAGYTVGLVECIIGLTLSPPRTCVGHAYSMAHTQPQQVKGQTTQGQRDTISLRDLLADLLMSRDPSRSSSPSSVFSNGCGGCRGGSRQGL